MGCLRAGSCEYGSGVLIITGGTQNLSVVLWCFIGGCRFGAAVFQQLPGLWLQMSGPLAALAGADGAPSGDPQTLISAMQVSTWPWGADGWQNLDRHSQHL